MAANLIYKNHSEKIEKIRQVKDTFLTGVRKLDGVVDNSGEAPHIASVSCRGNEPSELLLHALDAKAVYCSSGSACSSNHPAISGTLKAIGVEDELLNATLRFSFSVYSSVEEAEYAVQVLAEELPKRREFVKR